MASPPGHPLFPRVHRGTETVAGQNQVQPQALNPPYASFVFFTSEKWEGASQSIVNRGLLYSVSSYRNTCKLNPHPADSGK
jgi:hypothetical protein